jgi:hypothetical protein
MARVAPVLVQRQTVPIFLRKLAGFACKIRFQTFQQICPAENRNFDASPIGACRDQILMPDSEFSL